jgi:hypothetical protein
MGKATGTAVAARKSTLPANWEAQMKEDAAKGRAQVASIGVSRRLKTQGGVLQYMDAPVPGNKLGAVVLAQAFENALYAGDYDSANPQSPVCFAFGDDDKSLVPHEAAPKKQATTCAECKHNVFGTADKGRGKACKNQVVLMLMHRDALKRPDTIADAELVQASVSPTALKGWGAHVRKIDSLGNLPIYGYETELSLVNRQSGGHMFTFEVGKLVDRKLLPHVFQKAKDAQRELNERQPYQPLDDGEKPAPAKKKAKRKF